MTLHLQIEFPLLECNNQLENNKTWIVMARSNRLLLLKLNENPQFQQNKPLKRKRKNQLAKKGNGLRQASQMMKKRNLQLLNLWQILTMAVTLIVIGTLLLRTIGILNSLVNLHSTQRKKKLSPAFQLNNHFQQWHLKIQWNQLKKRILFSRVAAQTLSLRRLLQLWSRNQWLSRSLWCSNSKLIHHTIKQRSQMILLMITVWRVMHLLRISTRMISFENKFLRIISHK